MMDRCDWICDTWGQCTRVGTSVVQSWTLCRQHKKMLKIRKPNKPKAWNNDYP